MKKLEKILLVTVFLCILPVANLFALSQEAQNAIEAMRAKLLAEEKAQEAATEESTYIPGKELAAALERFRAKVHTYEIVAPAKIEKAEEVSAENSNVPETDVAVEENTDTRVIDQTDNEAINEITNNLAEEVATSFNYEAVKAELRKQNREALEAMRARLRERAKATSTEEATETEEAVASEETKEEATVEEVQPVVEKPETNQEDYVPGQLLEKSVAKFRREQKPEEPAEETVIQATDNEESQPEEIQESAQKPQDSHQVMEKANQEIEEIFNNPEKRAEIAEKGRKQVEARKAVQKKPEKKVEKPKARAKEKSDDDSDDSKQIDDERFNDYISRYNFKMPENYRIIVE